jgi:D-alanyl-D-alanine carboxypeptidase
MRFFKQNLYLCSLVIALIIMGIAFSVQRTTKLLNQDTLVQSPLNTVNSRPVTINSSLPSPYVKDQETKYSHFPYAEADTNRLMIIASYAQQEYQRFEQLDKEASLALMKMIYAARDEGVWLVPVSGFRNFTNQDLLFKNQVERRGSPEEAAKLSAPPGYSEHHTGYAIDLTDGLFPKKDITYDFEKTNSYQWLTIHAREFGFEMSFPANNSQGVNYEPWHWRFVGSPDASKIFARVHDLGL